MVFLVFSADSGVGRSWCLRAILRKQNSLKEHVWMEVEDGKRYRVWLDPWLQGVPYFSRLGRRCFMMRDRWVWIPGRQGDFSIASSWDTIHPQCGWVRWTGLLLGGGNVPKHSFCACWPLKIYWALEIGCICGIVRYAIVHSLPWGVESRDHLFFSYPFEGDVWSRVL
ncbi:zf-RVT domain-containing protein [Cucumis melo var. makuwa]|uniref:Zf-RVT domain-containing protein n=1 Tax=Cucumis melo var. makuwa TaxID=1194695 RepID=A0A5A7V501_CUCMM|nr:zf-RVT domain-containing protein [Cucumis melo var. makuwa]